MRPLRTRLAGVLLAVLTLTTAGCSASTGSGGDTGTDPDAKDPAAAAAAQPADRVEPLTGTPAPEFPVTVTSADGERLTLRAADRIVPLSGSLSEIVFSLGLGDRVVARDISTTFEQAADLPLVTRAHDVSAEGVLSLWPDLVLAETTSGPVESLDQIRAAGVPVLTVAPAKGLADVGPRIEAVAGALGVPSAGTELIERSEQRIAAVREDVPEQGTEQGADKPRVAFLYLRGSASVYLLGGADSGATSLIEAAGGVDAGAESGLTGDFTPLTSEALVKAAPDAILVMAAGLESVGGVDGLEKIPGIAQTPAGLDRRIVSVEDGVLLSYGPRTDQVLATVIDQLYPGSTE
ncbi:hemin ABC transporter substrate-binding protein [Streptomyces sp. NPDC056716]|uniref:heme/hemin ABC transporter substrate-binding protein n=1 Tax=unclassified Streptomyces TaxID=2593676 RepID=UPI003674052F